MRSLESSSPETLRRALGVTAALAVAVSAIACSSAAAPTTTEPPTRFPIQVTGAWVRPPTVPGGPAAAYFTIKNESGAADALVAVSSSVADSVDIHETKTDSGGMTGMHPVGRVEVPAGGTVTFQPGGYHLMLMGMHDGALSTGATIVLQLEFEHAGTYPVEAEVKQG
jgi:periplasmic copper chaperone A